MRASLMAAGVVALLIGAAPAAAGPPPASHAVGPVVVKGSAEGPLATVLRAAASEGLAASGAALIAPETVATILGAVPELATCDRKECLVRLASATGTSRVVAVAIDGKGELFEITVVVADDQGRPLRHRTDQCVACAVTELREQVKVMVRDAAGAAHDDEVAVDVESTPSGASLSVDGAEVGATPWHGTVVAGRHRLEAIGEGRARQDVFVEAGSAARWNLTLTADGGGRRWGKLTWITVGAGAGLLATGAVLVALDGRGTCGTDTCPEVYQTGLPGWTGVTLGVVGLAAGGWMYWQDRRHRRRDRPTVTVVPTRSGWTAAVTGRF